MALDHTSLDPAALSEAARKVVTGPAPVRLMAARGLAPLARPGDLISVLYQLGVDSDAALAQAADKTARELPDKIVSGGLQDGTLDPRVLDWFATRLMTRPTLLSPIILNPASADETIALLAAKLGDAEIDLIAQNEQRLLRAPAIIAAMYLNPRARMSTVDRAVELAVRNQLVVPGIPSWDAIVHAVLGTQPVLNDEAAAVGTEAAPVVSTVDAAAGDAAFAAAAAKFTNDADTEADKVAAALIADETGEAVSQEAQKMQIDKLSIPGKVRLATLGNAFARSVLIRDSNKLVAMAAIRSPKVTDDEVMKYAHNKALHVDVIRLIAGNKAWTRTYAIKVALVLNSKCPLPFTMRFLPLMQDRDMRTVAQSKGVPSALVNQAKKLLALKGK